MAAEPGEPLTERELEITELVADGLTNREIAAELYISHNTVKVHLRNVFTKAGVSSRTELSMLAVQKGWISVPGQTEEETEATAEREEESEKAPEPTSEIEPWPWFRWAALSLGGLVAIALLLLPAHSSAQILPGEPGEIFEQANTNTNVLVAAEDAGWQELPPLPVRRAGMAATLWGSEIMIVGGMTDQGPSGRLDLYNLNTQTWTEGPSRPVALANVSAAVLSKGLLVPGGCDQSLQPKQVTHLYDPMTQAWTEVAPLPVPLCAYGLTVYDGHAYLFGGWDGKTYQALAYEYDPQADAWFELPPPKEARGFGSAATLENRLFYVGGFNGEREWPTCEVFIPEEDRWESCAPMLQPRGGLALASLGGQLYAVGGGWQTVLGFNERYNPRTDEWTVLETPIVGEWRNLGIVARETDLYVIGGWSGQGFLNRTYMLEALPWRVFIPGAFRNP